MSEITVLRWTPSGPRAHPARRFLAPSVVAVMLLAPAVPCQAQAQSSPVTVTWAELRGAVEGTICVGWQKKFKAYEIKYSASCDAAPADDPLLKAMAEAVLEQRRRLVLVTQEFGEGSLFVRDGDGYATSDLYCEEPRWEVCGTLYLDLRSNGKPHKGEAHVAAIRAAFVDDFFANDAALAVVLDAVRAVLEDAGATCPDCPDAGDGES